MNQTEEQHAEWLINEHYDIGHGCGNPLRAAIFDCKNTIKALDNLSHRVDAYVYDKLAYYKSVLQILEIKDKL
jgi:hypothetical protein